MTVKMMKVVAAMSIAVCLGTASAQQTISINFGQQGTSEAPQAESDTVKVQGRGVGVNKTAALKDAYRDAIERAVGLYVDAETVANNDQIVKDQVLTQSNAYITDYRELSSERIDVGFEVRILATVKKQALTTKLTDVMPAQTVRIDNAGLQNVHAQLVTKEKRAEDAVALLKNALDGLNPMKSLMVANIRPDTQKIITADDVNNDRRRYRREAQLKSNQVMLRYLFEVKLDREKYFAEFMPHLRKVLDQISITKPKEIRLTELMPDLSRNDARGKWLKKYLDMDFQNVGYDTHHSSYGTFYEGRDFHAFFDPIHVYSILWKGDNWVWRGLKYDYCSKTDSSSRMNDLKLTYMGFRENENFEKVYFALITSLSNDGSNGKVTMYELDKSVITILNAWCKDLTGNRGGSEIKSTDYNIVLLDKNGEEIGVYPWRIPNDLLENVKYATIGYNNDKKGMVYVTPFVGCVGESLIQWRDFILEKDQLTKVASIKIEPAD